MTVTTLPTAPQRTQTPTVFATNADAFVAALPQFVTDVNALQADVTSKQTTASTAATNAAASASAAAASAASAATAGNAAAWQTGTNYTLGTCVWSPINYKTYRCKVAGVSTTDPSLDGTTWGSPVATRGDGGSASTTGHLTLTNSSSGAQTVTPAAPGYYVTLPDATTCELGAGLFVIHNTGNYDYGIKNNSGTQLGWIRPGKVAVVSLSARATAAGTWVISNMEKLGVTAQFLNTTVTSNSTNLQRITIDSNRTAFLFGNTTLYAVVYDSSQAAGSQWGTVVTVRSSVGGSSHYTGILSAASQLLVVSFNATAMEAVTITVDATTGLTVNSGTKGTATLAGTWNATGQLKAVGSAWVVSYGRQTTVSAIRPISISGTTPTIGNESAATSASGTVDTAPTIYAWSSSVVLAIEATSSTLYAKPWTVSGSSNLVAGTEASTAVSAVSYRSQALGSGNICIFHLNTYFKAAIASVSGTTAVISVSTISSTVTPANAINVHDVVTVSNTKLCVTYNSSSTTFGVNHITDTAGTAGAGTEITCIVQGSLSSNIVGIGLSGSTAIFYNSTSNNNKFTISVDTSGTSPVLSSITFLNTASVAQMTAPNLYGVRSGNHVIGGTTAYSILPSVAAGVVNGLQVTAGAISQIPLINVPANQTPAAISGASNESWVISCVSSSIGAIISRVEAAA